VRGSLATRLDRHRARLYCGAVGQINGVLFDVGGVLVGLDGVPSLAGLLGVAPSHDDLHRRWMSCPSVRQHETGKISADEFAADVVTELGLALSPEAFLRELDSWLTAPLPGAFELVARIPQRCRVGILSNMSAFHWRRVVDMALPDRFDFICVSCEIGFLKPSRAAFETALDRMALPPDQVLFLDDGTVNVDAARDLGLVAHLVRNVNETERVLKAFAVL
jgi:HAD superfamily hydrolase (TIGR01509 family)